MRIAVIGSGISGLGAAYLLSSSHEVTLYEKEQRLGGHSRTLTIQPLSFEDSQQSSERQDPVAVDTGFIVFNHRNYPHLTALFKHLSVPVVKSDMSFGVSLDQGRLEYGTQGISSLFAQRRNILKPRFLRMIRDILHFNKQSRAFLVNTKGSDNQELSLEEYLATLNLGDLFQSAYILAMGSAIWSTAPTQMRDFPAQSFLRFFENHGLLSSADRVQWYTVVGGSQTYVKCLKDSLDASDVSLRLGRSVTRVIRSSRDGKQSVEVIDSKGERAFYDHVILACHSDQALALLESPTVDEQQILGAIRYQPNRAVLHSDINFMPRHRKAWASWVYLAENKENGGCSVNLSYWMNNLQPLVTSTPVIATLNPTQEPDPAVVYDDHIFEHPIFDHKALQAQKRLLDIQGQNGVSFCGAWQGYGFHEDGLKSAVTVARSLGCEVPWEVS